MSAKPRPRSAQFPSLSRRYRQQDTEQLKRLEKGFLLDGVAMSHLANDEVDRSNPSVNIGIPQYLAGQDGSCKAYFKRKGLPKQVGKKEESMMGRVFDNFAKRNEAAEYLQERVTQGVAYTRKLYGGHLSVPTNPPMDGYHGQAGYRRNTPDLRKHPSVFDYEDPFDNPKPINRRLRTQSAPATMRLLRLKSATAYRSTAGRRIQSAMPQQAIATPRELVTGPIT